MFEIGWTEMLVIAVVMIVVVGPKDLPKMLRAFGKTTAKLRSMAGDFQRQFNEALKEAELDDVKKSVDSLRSLNPATEIKKQLNPFEKAASDVRAGLDTLKPKPPEPASSTAVAAEPLKNGAAAMPGEGADAASDAPTGLATAADTPTAPAAAPATPAPAAAVEAAAASTAAPAQSAAALAPAAAPTPVAVEAAPAPPKAKKPRAAKKKADGTAAAKPKAAPRKKKTEGNAP